jgi:hypothetical protein
MYYYLNIHFQGQRVKDFFFFKGVTWMKYVSVILQERWLQLGDLEGCRSARSDTIKPGENGEEVVKCVFCKWRGI